MKGLVKFAVLALIVGLLVGLNVRQCRTEPITRTETITDTLRVFDTVRVVEPVPRDSTIVRYVTVKLPVATAERDTSFAPDIYVGSKTADSADVVIPITQKVYEDSNYTAWVSGYKPSLDSIAIRTVREVVTVKEFRKPKRWNVGAFVGYGITPKGMQPCVGVSVNYRLMDF